jgi:predicted enzyme related to lactoylglutathione lyase
MPDSNALATRSLVQVALTTRDLTKARDFYRGTLGLPLLSEAGEMLFFQLGNVRLMIGASPSQPVGGAILYFDAPDILRLGPMLEDRGVRFLAPLIPFSKTRRVISCSESSSIPTATRSRSWAWCPADDEAR